MLKPYLSKDMLAKLQENTLLDIISNILYDMGNPDVEGDSRTLMRNPTFKKVLELVKKELEIIYEGT